LGTAEKQLATAHARADAMEARCGELVAKLRTTQVLLDRERLKNLREQRISSMHPQPRKNAADSNIRSGHSSGKGWASSVARKASAAPGATKGRVQEGKSWAAVVRASEVVEQVSHSECVGPDAHGMMKGSRKGGC